VNIKGSVAHAKQKYLAVTNPGMAGGPSFALSAKGEDSGVQGPWDSDSFSEGCAVRSGSAEIRSET
jgi:hypothetical protein